MVARRRGQHPASNPLQPEMVTVSAGTFIMGTTPREVQRLSRQAPGSRQEWYAREQPAHRVKLPAFQMGRYPVTVEEFAVFINAGGYTTRHLWSETGWQWRAAQRVTYPAYWDEARFCGQPDFPIVGVSWFTAQAYCAWLRHETGLPYRLPHEVEWEKAARGPDGHRYPWGNRWDRTRCNTTPQVADSWDSWDDPAPADEAGLLPVGQFSPQGDSPYGCADMAGNVWEWCVSPLSRYPLRPGYETTRPEDDPRVVRGGSWYDGPEDARCATRYCYHPHGRDNVVGFRLALSR